PRDEPARRDLRDEDAARGPRAPRFGVHAREERRPQWNTTRLFIGLGRIAGVRPGDLVGAIANEAGVPGHAIGGIQIADRFSLVEVPAEAAEQVLQALRGTTIRGRRVFARRDRDEGG
ncbi:MAG: ATP-dependent helicase, partial [Planctomycetes bacterium]|nr:ATP-dependent helicase [Planctomycetota bacterium]